MIQLHVKACAYQCPLCGAALSLYFNTGQQKWSVSGNWLFKSESHRLFELNAQLPRLYGMPMTSLAGNTGTIPYSMSGNAETCIGSYNHTLPITFLGPSLSGHLVFGISSPWAWLLGGNWGVAMAWRHQTCFFCRQDMHVPAGPVGCSAAETTAG
jgi:hypothetical protein